MRIPNSLSPSVKNLQRHAASPSILQLEWVSGVEGRPEFSDQTCGARYKDSLLTCMPGVRETLTSTWSQRTDK